MTEAPGNPKPNDGLSSLRVPKALQVDVAEIAALIDEVRAEHLDDEYGALCLRLLAKLARKRPSPRVHGERRVWAAAALYTVGSINFLFDPARSRTCAPTSSPWPPGWRSPPWPTRPP